MFFFFKQKTAYEIVSRDWSSDVCSSDLPIIFTSIYASDKKCILKVITDGIKLGIEHPGIDALMTKPTRTLAMRLGLRSP